jgi:hypothetical protein
MFRSFLNSLRPPFQKPSVAMNNHRLSFSRAINFAEKITQHHETLDYSKKFDLYLNAQFPLSLKDMSSLCASIGENHPEEGEVRSLWLDLHHPIFDSNQNLEILQFQVKGVMFDERNGVQEYVGNGWTPEVYFADQHGEIFRRYSTRASTLGRCQLIEAVFEFLLCSVCSNTFNGTMLQVPSPIGWGRYRSNDTLENTDFGFVILGLPRLQPGREAVYLEAVKKCHETENPQQLIELFKLRSRAIGYLHRHNILSQGRHFGNFSLTVENQPFIHDLGAVNSFVRQHLYNDNQYAAEAFAHLIYACTPRKICIPVPSEGHMARTVLMQHYDVLLSASLSEYYQTDEAANFKLEDLEIAFFDCLKMPVQESKTPFARFHTRFLKKWLANMNSAENASFLNEHVGGCMELAENS